HSRHRPHLCAAARPGSRHRYRGEPAMTSTTADPVRPKATRSLDLKSRRAARRRDAAQLWGKTALLGVILLWCLFPFFWLIMTSLKQGDRALNSPNLFQGPFGFQNYLAVFQQNFHLNLRNSFVVAGTTTILCVVIGTLCAYAIARLPMKGKVLLLSGVLAVSLFPPVALVPPLYELWRSLGLL